MTNQAFLRCEIEDVVFIDPGCNDDDGYNMDLICGRCILDHFQQFIAEHHRTWRTCDILTQLVGVLVNHADVTLT